MIDERTSCKSLILRAASTYKQEVTGSNPVAPTNPLELLLLSAPSRIPSCASLVSTLPLQAL